MESLGNARFLRLWRFAPHVLTGAAFSALALCAVDVMDVGYALSLAGMLFGVRLLLEEPKPD